MEMPQRVSLNYSDRILSSVVTDGTELSYHAIEPEVKSAKFLLNV
jgi:hypothetical protein